MQAISFIQVRAETIGSANAGAILAVLLGLIARLYLQRMQVHGNHVAARSSRHRLV
jgi:hypothetical protein